MVKENGRFADVAACTATGACRWDENSHEKSPHEQRAKTHNARQTAS